MPPPIVDIFICRRRRDFYWPSSRYIPGVVMILRPLRVLSDPDPISLFSPFATLFTISPCPTLQKVLLSWAVLSEVPQGLVLSKISLF